MRELRVNAIQQGTVIDHLPVESVYKIVEILQAQDSEHEVLIGTNLQSKKLGRKGIIKLSNRFLTHTTINKISLLASGASIATIKNYQVDTKETIGIPDSVGDIVQCFNPNCITNHERAVTKFKVQSKQPLKLQCHYCEKVMSEAQIIFR